MEQVLVALWSEKIEYPLEPSHRIKPEDAALAERATGITASRQKRIGYWLEELEMTRPELTSTLAKMGLVLNPRANTLPKGAVRRLRPLLSEVPPSTAPPALEKEAELPWAPPFLWMAPGTIRNCTHLSTEEILQVHEALTEEFALSDDPIFPPGVKSQALLESAAGRPSTGFGSALKYPTVESAAGALLHSLVHNHPFHNGNKRTALVSTLVFLDRHNLLFESTEIEMFRFMVRVAAHDLLDANFRHDNVADREVGVIAALIIKNSRAIRREERSLTWRELSKKLRAYGCEFEAKGEKITISRSVRRPRRFFPGLRVENLGSLYINTGQGRVVPRNILKRIRQDLHLDFEHGIDAEMFYGGQKGPDYFIHQYSTLLKRLARV